MERKAHSTSSLDAYFSTHTNPPPHANNAGSGHMTPTGGSVAHSINGGGSEAGSYFTSTSAQSTSGSESNPTGYYTADSTPTRRVRLPSEDSEVDEDEEQEGNEKRGGSESQEGSVEQDEGSEQSEQQEDEDLAAVTAAIKGLSTPTMTHTPTGGSRPSTPSAIGLDFGDLDMDMSPRNRGHQSPPVIC